MMNTSFSLFFKRLRGYWTSLKRYLPFSLSDAAYLYLLAGIVFVFGVGLALWFWHDAVVRFFSNENSANRDRPAAAEAVDSADGGEMPCKIRRTLDGVCVDDEARRDSPLIGVMVENASDAWPLAGLASASVVYEAPAEGNIPRFLAIYPADAQVDKVGPVRSARPYYLDWMAEYGTALYMHVGGSPEALARISRRHAYVDIDEFYRGWYFWRSRDRYAPHNTYTATSLWRRALDEAGKEQASEIDGWRFEEMEECSADCVTEITASFLPPTYDATWKYSASSTQYFRYQNYREHRDEDGGHVAADTVIVQRVRSAVIDDAGRQRITTIGEGEALIFRNGHKIEGTWKKTAETARTRWLDKNGNEIALQPGKIWIEVLPLGRSVTFK